MQLDTSPRKPQRGIRPCLPICIDIHINSAMKRKPAKSPSRTKKKSTSTATQREGRTEPTLDFSRSPFAIIESILSPSGAPVLGLHLHVAHMVLSRGFEQQLGQGQITANWIGIVALVSAYPGISQIDLAKLIRMERATIGDRVARCIGADLIRRVDSAHEPRKYALYVTAHGERVLQHAREKMPAHEKEFTAGLTAEERKTLQRLLDKLVPDWGDQRG
jgi:DNA-binding MarR family transcriptional regulator